MSPEELLKMLKEGGLDDAAIKQLLSDALASLEGPAEEKPEPEPNPEEAERAEASDLLGVNL